MANLIRLCNFCNPEHTIETIDRPDLPADVQTHGMCDQAKAAWDAKLDTPRAAQAAQQNQGGQTR